METINKVICELVVRKNKEQIWLNNPDDYEAIRDMYYQAQNGNIYKMTPEYAKIITLLQKQPDIYSENDKIADNLILQFDALAKRVAYLMNYDLNVLKSSLKDRDSAEIRQLTWQLAIDTIDYSPWKKSRFIILISGYYNRDRVTAMHGLKVVKDTIFRQYADLKIQYKNLYTKQYDTVG
jgi:hypothetical protein